MRRVRRERERERKAAGRQAPEVSHNCHQSASSWRHWGIFSPSAVPPPPLSSFSSSSLSPAALIMTTIHQQSFCAVRSRVAFFFCVMCHSASHSSAPQQPSKTLAVLTDRIIVFFFTLFLQLFPRGTVIITRTCPGFVTST